MDSILLPIVVNGIISGSIYVLIATGFAIIYRTVKFFHFAHGVVYATGAYLAYSVLRIAFSEGSGPSAWILGILGGVLGAGIVGVLIDRIVYKLLRKRKAPNLVFLIASFGVFIFIQNLRASLRLKLDFFMIP